MRKPDSKNAEGKPNKGQQVSVVAQENLKLVIFLYYYQWRCTFDWEATGVHEDMVKLLTVQKRLKYKYKDPDAQHVQ